MPTEIFPSSYECDCGHQSHFFEGTIRAMKRMSRRKEVRLADAEPDEHVIVFYGGEMVAIRCPHQSRGRGPMKRTAKSRSRKKRSPKRGYQTQSKRRLQRLWNNFMLQRYATHAAGMSLAIEADFSILTAKIMDVSIPFVGWHTPARWTSGRSLSTNTAMSGMMTRNGSFRGADTSMGR
jgi:hypothetical protein